MNTSSARVLLIATVLALLACPRTAAADYGPDGLLLCKTSAAQDEEAAQRAFFDGFYVPDFKEGVVLVRSQIPRYCFAEHYIPTVVDGMRKVERNGYGNCGADFPPCPQQKFFWCAFSARGWLLAKLKGVGNLDAFEAPYLLRPPCQFNTSLFWERYADNCAKGRSEMD